MAKRAKRVRRFTPEFIEQAVRLINETNRPLSDVAKELGVGKSTLVKWRNKAEGRTHAAELVDRSEETPAEELKRLRQRVRELEMEKSILKKAAAFFAKENS